jgi:hypothetical protein
MPPSVQPHDLQEFSRCLQVRAAESHGSQQVGQARAKTLLLPLVAGRGHGAASGFCSSKAARRMPAE